MTRSRKSRPMRWLAILLFWMFYAMAFGVLGESHSGEIPLLTLMLASILAFVSVLVHELGHAIAVRWAGGRVRSIMAFPFQLHLRPLRVGMAELRGRGDVAGYVEWSPVGSVTRRQRAIISAAGPAADFVLATVALIIVYCLGFMDWVAGGPVVIEALPRQASSAMPPSGMLPSDAEVARWMAAEWKRRMAETSGILLTALAVLSIGGGLTNLLPFDDSDGQSIIDALFKGRWA